MILDKIVEDKKKRLEEHKAKIPPEEMKRMALECNRKTISLAKALSKPGLSIVAVFLKASPSKGVIRSKVDLEERIKQYNEAVDAITVVTEEDHFQGSPEYLKYIRERTNLPIIRWDFIIDEYQVYEAKVLGADAIFLIMAILDDETFKRLYDLAYSLGLDVVVLVYDEEELKRALNLGVKIIEIMNINLKTFEVSMDTTKRLASLLPEEFRKKDGILMTIGGISTDEDVKRLKKAGVDAFVITEALMEADNPKELVKHWKEVYNNG
uniref:Kemp Elimination n=1 Tax=Escherichia coli TaxID=562 RepID=UPI003D81C68E